MTDEQSAAETSGASGGYTYRRVFTIQHLKALMDPPIWVFSPHSPPLLYDSRSSAEAECRRRRAEDRKSYAAGYLIKFRRYRVVEVKVVAIGVR